MPYNFFDTIVIGAGLAGLSAAYELSQRPQQRVLVLEANTRLGGKVYTGQWHHITYEKGALFAFNPQWIPFSAQTGHLIPSDDPIGVFLNNRLVTGRSVQECLQAFGTPLRSMLCLNWFLDCESPQPQVIDESVYAILDSFFKAIHSGDLRAYTPTRRRDCLSRYDLACFETGNKAVVKAFQHHITADIRTGCCVSGIDATPDQVTVNWVEDSHTGSAQAKWVILAVPAPKARCLITQSQSVAKDFLDKIHYGAGIVVILGLYGTMSQRFSCLVCPEGTANTFFFRYPETDFTLITAYIVAEKVEACLAMTDEQIIDAVFRQFQAIKIDTVERQTLAFTDICRWPAVGPVISQQAYEGFSNASLRPFDRVVLAGDYTWWDDAQMPYGMYAAIASGRRAAEMLSAEPTVLSTGFRAKPIAMTQVIAMTEQGPRLDANIADGTVAYYGLVLLANPDPELEHYLIGEAIECLWPYQQGYGVTSLDSALVMEGLLHTGAHTALLNRSADRLVEMFFDIADGGFRTLSQQSRGRAPYWMGTDCVATAYCAWLLLKIAPERHAKVIAACVHYLKRKQLITGNWSGKWFPSDTIPIFYAMRLLTALGQEECQTANERAGLWLCSQQKNNGSWKDSVIETAAAILALSLLGKDQVVINRACAWIRLRAQAGQWPGEPILHYWFEENNQKVFFHTTDTGLITSAWAKIALATAESQSRP